MNWNDQVSESLFSIDDLGSFFLWMCRGDKGIRMGHLSSQHLGPFLIGLAFAFGWTPCVGPILAGILALAATQSTVIQGTLLLFIYSMGLGIPFILTGLSVNVFLRFFNCYKKFTRWGEIFAGVLLVLVGALIFSKRLTLLISHMPEWLFKFSI